MGLPFARRLFIALVVFAVGPATRGQTNAVPFLYPLTSATTPGGKEFTLTVNGTGFAPGAVVNWNGSARTTTFVNSSQVTAAITAADIATPKTAVITVTNPAPGGGTSNAINFEVTYPTTGVTFQDSPISPGVYQPKVLAGDVNGDGKPDLVVWGFDLTANKLAIRVLLGNGDGTFQAPVTTFPAPGVNVTDLALGDVNGDGKADLIGFYNKLTGVSTQVSGTLALLGNGDGTFQAALYSDVAPVFNFSRMTLIADVNGDGKPDLVRACRIGVCVELGNGDGTFHQQFTYTPTNSVGGLLSLRSVTLGDFHKNGKLDIVAIIEPYYVVMLPGNGDGTFGAASIVYGGPDAILTDSVLAADFDNDGNLDLAVYYANAAHGPPPAGVGAMDILPGNGDGTFQAPLTLAGLTETDMQSVLVAGDFNGDGHIDLATQNEVILIGNGNGPFSYSVITTSNYGAFATVAADFNGDGRLDLAGIDFFNSNLVHVLLQTSVPDFAGSINDPGYQDVKAGETATYTISVDSLNGFAGKIEFQASGLPPGATATFTPSTLVGSGTVAVTVFTSKETPRGSYPILVSGSSVGITHSGVITLNVGPPHRFMDFGGTVTPAYQTIIPGSSTTYQINILPINGFTNDVRLSASGLPAGGTATFSPNIVAGGSGSSVLTVSLLSSTPTGTYRLTITGTSGGRTHDNTVAVNVGPAGTDFTDFTGSITPQSQIVHAGGSASYTVNVQLLYGTGCVTLQTLNIPPAAAALYDRTTPICGASASTVLTVVTSPQTPTGTYAITIQGYSSGGFTHSQNITLTVTP